MGKKSKKQKRIERTNRLMNDVKELVIGLKSSKNKNEPEPQQVQQAPKENAVIVREYLAKHVPEHLKQAPVTDMLQYIILNGTKTEPKQLTNNILTNQPTKQDLEQTRLPNVTAGTEVPFIETESTKYKNNINNDVDAEPGIEKSRYWTIFDERRKVVDGIISDNNTLKNNVRFLEAKLERIKALFLPFVPERLHTADCMTIVHYITTVLRSFYKK